MTKFNFLLQDLSDLVCAISLGCYGLKIESTIEKELAHAKTIVTALNNINQNTLSLLSLVHRQDLIDAIKIHGLRYNKEYKKHDLLKDDSLVFELCLNQLLEKLSSIADKNNLELDSTEIDFLSAIFYKILKKIQIFFANQHQNKETLDFIHALSVVHRIKNVNHINFEEQIILVDLLLIVKELWNVEYYKYKIAKIEIPKILREFYSNPSNILQIDIDDFNTEKIFNLVIDVLSLPENSVLIYLQDEQILSLYDKLKDYQGSAAGTIFDLLQKIYTEAQFRYSYNRLSDIGYKLLSRFQNFDAINHQIESLEFHILEAHLFKKSNFTKEVLVNITKHSDNIRALSLNKDQDLHKIFNHINRKLDNQSKGIDGSIAMLSSLKNSLNKFLPPHIKKRYLELDKFNIKFLKQKYCNLFANIVSVLENTDDGNKFLKNILTQRLASDYYLPHLSNSIGKLRLYSTNRKKVITLLSELNFLDIFSPGNFNNISSFNFRNTDKTNELKTPIEYIKLLIEDICLHVNAFQLETLYKSVSCNAILTETQSLLIDCIKTQIKQRMTVRKLLYSMISGRKKEYDKLRSLKRISNESTIAP